MTDFQNEKKRLRIEALARRNALDPEYRRKAAGALCESAAHIAISPGMTISGFWPIRSEMDVRPLLSELRRRGARICLPHTANSSTLVFRLHEEGAPLQESGFGTMAPGEEADTVEPEVLLVPLAAFDRKGNRVGYGAGYYDRAIARLAEKGCNPEVIGIAFDCQEVSVVPVEPHDIPLNAILTESGLRSFRSER